MPSSTDPGACPGEEVLLEYAQGSLGSAIRDRVDRHLAACETCRQVCAIAMTGTADCGGPGPAKDDIPGYQRQELLGAGAMGVMYAARQGSDVELVAVRLINPALVEGQSPASLLRRARRLLSIRHEGLVPFIDCGLVEGELYLTRRLASGRHPGVPTRRRQPNLHWRTAVAGIRQLGRALHALHRAGHVHGRLGRSDVWVQADGSAQLTDYGLLEVIHGTPSPQTFDRAADDDRVAFCQLALEMLEPLGAPRRILRALEHGSQQSAPLPYRTMGQLVACLDRDLQPRRWTRLAPVAGLLGLTVFMSGDSIATPAHPTCSQMVPRWDSADRQRLRDAFERSRDPSAEAIVSRVETLLDEHIAQLETSTVGSCEHAPTTADDAVCSAGHRAAFETLIEKLTDSPSPGVMRRAIEGVHALPSPESCPRSARAEAIEILTALGQIEDAEARARYAVTDAGGDATETVAALVRLGEVLRQREPAEAQQVLMRAHELAQTHGLPTEAGRSAVQLLRLQAELPSSSRELRLWAGTVQSYAESLPTTDPSLAEALETLGDAQAELGDLEEAIASLRGAIQVLVTATTQDVAVARLQDKLARVLVSRGDLDEAESVAAKAWSSRMRYVGPHHPEVAESHLTMAQLASARSMPYAARHHAEAALAIVDSLEDVDPFEAARTRVAARQFQSEK